MRSAVSGLKAAAVVVLVAGGLSACQQSGAQEDMMSRYESDVTAARNAAEQAAQSAAQAQQAAERAEAAAQAAQRQAEASSRMYQQGMQK